MQVRIDLIYIGAVNTLQWQHGEVYYTADSVSDIYESLNTVRKQSTSEWVLLWHEDNGLANEEFVKLLITQKVDVWHAGLKMGMQGLPDAINYINPAWVYNKDASPDIESSSFRLSIYACLMKRALLQYVCDLQLDKYISTRMLGIAMGYALIKQGAVMRHHPGLVRTVAKPVNAPAMDEWIFVKQFFPKKWQWWVAYNKKGVAQNIRYLITTKNIHYKHLQPAIHASDNHVTAEYNTVSVLAPTLDRYSYLHNELEQLSVQTIKPIEVLITDQTDSDRRQDIDTEKYPELQIKCFPQSEKGQCIAWNKLLEEAKGEYVLFLGDDADNITARFIEKLLSTSQRYDADIVASNVVEIGLPEKKLNPYYYMSDTFPITLAKRDVVEKAGNMDMFFNKNIRADYDLALRCHANGALMIFDSSAIIHHHRAPVGGLRTHKARTITNRLSKNSITRFAEPTSSELFLVKKHFDKKQFKMFVRIKYFDQLVVSGSVFRKLLRLLVFVFKIPGFIKRYNNNLSLANNELKQRGLFKY